MSVSSLLTSSNQTINHIKYNNVTFRASSSVIWLILTNASRSRGSTMTSIPQNNWEDFFAYDKILSFGHFLSSRAHPVATTPRRSGLNIWKWPKPAVPLHPLSPDEDLDLFERLEGWQSERSRWTRNPVYPFRVSGV